VEEEAAEAVVVVETQVAGEVEEAQAVVVVEGSRVVVAA